MKKNKNKYLSFCVTSIIVCGVSSNILAATTAGTDTFIVNAQITGTGGGAGGGASSCSINNITNVDFPEINLGISHAADIFSNVGGFDINCTNGSGYNVKLTSINNQNSSYFFSKLKNAGSSTEYLDYFLLNTDTPQSHSSSSPIHWTSSGKSGTGNGSNIRYDLLGHTYSSYLNAAVNRNITPGSTLTDTVTITLTIN